MGSGQSSNTLHCNEYLNGKGPPTLIQQGSRDAKKTNVGFQCGSQQGTKRVPAGDQACPSRGPSGSQQGTKRVPAGDQACPSRGPSVSQQGTKRVPAGTKRSQQGTKRDNHPHPGTPFAGLRQWAYLPDNREGRKVLRLLDKGFNQGLLFTVATNQEGADVVSPTFVPFKTQPDGGTKT
ncbi:hypothetical protein NHX12_021418 [Muraenolepis orangiensis]|uniref:E3 ubiquitin-protein ligase n=1 Tax=Muraenolepis orangiensis TaxID=630683 RepID=A0A9Q0ETJ0_9TELE|nr:hypothetical protein NHX12_021418 [Muraenolepis orangiensis]